MSGLDATPTPPESPFKGKTGLARIISAAGYSWAGLFAAFRYEDAFRQEVFLALLLIPLGLYLGESGIERISLEHHDLIKRAKDMGSAAVMIALVNVAVVWALVLLD